jgi:5-carboxymethyl-2-hydroxymuconic-semialdehyde dehydrogenase
MKLSEASVAGVAVNTRHWIGGRRVASPGTFTDLSPIDGQPLAEVARGGAAEVAAAVQAAREAFGGWSQTPPPDRAAVLHAIADGIERRIEDLSQVETGDNGALLRSHRRSVMPRVAQNFRFFAGWLGELDGGGLEISGHREQVSWAPAGVTAVITPWNTPLMLATWRIAPALAAGNNVHRRHRPGGTGIRPAAGGHRVGQLLLRPGPAGAVRRRREEHGLRRTGVGHR